VCFPGMTSSLAKSKEIIGAHVQTLFSTIFLFLDVPQYSNRFDYIKDIRPAIYFDNQKIIAYHYIASFKEFSLGGTRFKILTQPESPARGLRSSPPACTASQIVGSSTAPWG